LTDDNNELRIVVFSGPICSGKSELARKLKERYDAQIIKTRDLIRYQLPSVKEERDSLQKAGEKLDRQDGGAWVQNALSRFLQAEQQESTPTGLFVIDSVRIQGQIDAVRRAFGTAVHHVHLTADEKVLAARYKRRGTKTKEFKTYAEVKRSPTERNVEALGGSADIVVDTDRCTPDAVLLRATALLNLYPRAILSLVDVIIGGQYGSEGKGNIVGHIAPEYDLLVRVGGPNAGHKVFAEPNPETYHHLPSGTGRAPHAQLLLGAGAVLFPKKLLEEIAIHRVSADRLSIDPQAMVIEEKDRKFEERMLAAISSTFQGVGAASARKIMGRGGKSSPRVRLAKDVEVLKPFIRDGQDILKQTYLRNRRVLLEGTQGTSLSIHHGIYPYVTSRDTTVAGCLADAGIAPRRIRRVIMVCRTFPIRVGGPSGPMGIPITYVKLSMRSGIPVKELKTIEKTTTTGKQRRLAEFDWEQLHKSATLNGPTDIALTFVDYISVKNKRAYRFEQLTEETQRFVEEVQRVSGVPVSMLLACTRFRRHRVRCFDGTGGGSWRDEGLRGSSSLRRCG
jgi:adenylosuccinate synthase